MFGLYGADAPAPAAGFVAPVGEDVAVGVRAIAGGCADAPGDVPAACPLPEGVALAALLAAGVAEVALSVPAIGAADFVTGAGGAAVVALADVPAAALLPVAGAAAAGSAAAAA
ncbi:MAG: hypothetical protein PCALPYG88_3552 [uncultured Paraburkholderia sp.]|nr:MAG: hypothetical protein PCALPYG08_3530 [uncultured Paraburkholderia sp.]CAH2925810.1 MAG: hypothetical protein PCALPYG88_3552 [uncultured Paraburkholderia sp.]